MNNDVQLITTGLKITLPSISSSDLLAFDSPSAEFAAHVPSELGKDYWLYSVNGNLLDGELIVVRAYSPLQAETIAQEGLKKTIESISSFSDNTGIQVTAEVVPA